MGSQQLAPHLVSHEISSRCVVSAQGGFVQERVYSAPCGGIRDLAAPHGCSDLLASCSAEEIRLWDVARQTELLRVHAPSLDCLCLAISQVGACLTACHDDSGMKHMSWKDSGVL